MNNNKKTIRNASNEYNNLFFRSKKDLMYYTYLEKLKESGFIHSFSLEQYCDEKTNEIKYQTKSVEIDEKHFQSKADADYYLHLKKLLNRELIRDFSLQLIQDKKTKASKYLAKKVEIDGHLFHSKEEANYYIYLLEKKRNNEILGFEIQKKYELQSSFKKNGKNFRRIDYIADFEVYHTNNDIEVIDVKGMITPEFSIKRKLFEYKFTDKKLTLIKYVERYGGWIEYDEWRKLVRKKNNN